MPPLDDRALVEAAIGELLGRFPEPSTVEITAFRGAQYDLGLAWVHFDRGAGGLGVAAGHQGLIEARLRQAGAPPPNDDYVGMHQAAAAMHAVGTHEQRRASCGGSSPVRIAGASCSASPAPAPTWPAWPTAAVRDGDEWVVQRTEGVDQRRPRGPLGDPRGPHEPRHLQASRPDLLRADMRAPGIDVRPIRQADGAAHFNEVFLDRRPPPRHAPPGRRRAGVGDQPGRAALRARRHRRRLLPDADHPAGRGMDTPIRSDLGVSRVALKDRVVRAWMRHRVAELNEQRRRREQGGRARSPLGSLAKIALAELNQRTERRPGRADGAGRSGRDRLRRQPRRGPWRLGSSHAALRDTLARQLDRGRHRARSSATSSASRSSASPATSASTRIGRGEEVPRS